MNSRTPDVDRFLHYEVDLESDDLVRVALGGAANVLLMDDRNFDHYRSGRSYRYHGGLATTSPFLIRAPAPGRWHVVVDLGGYPGTVRAKVDIVQTPINQVH